MLAFVPGLQPRDIRLMVGDHGIFVIMQVKVFPSPVSLRFSFCTFDATNDFRAVAALSMPPR